MFKVQIHLEALVGELNALCQADEQYALVRHPRNRQTETGYTHSGYYLVYRGSQKEWQPATRWPYHAGEGYFIGTNALEATRYIRQLLKERQQARSVPSTWWENANKPRTRRKRQP